ARLDLTGILDGQGEVRLALGVDLGVEHLVLEERGGLRLQVDVRPVGLEDLVVRVRPRRGRDLEPARIGRVSGGRRDPQACRLRRVGGSGQGLDDLSGRFCQYQHRVTSQFGWGVTLCRYRLSRELNPGDSFRQRAVSMTKGYTGTI